MGNAFTEAFMAGFPAVKEGLARAQAFQRKAAENFTDNCKLLGLVPSDELQEQASQIQTAAEIKPACNACMATVAGARLCPHVSKLYEQGTCYRKNDFLACHKYEQWQKVRQKQETTARLMGNSGLGKRFQLRRFETFEVTAETAPAYNACLSFCDGFTPESKGLRLIGDYGTGKTHLTAAIIHRLAEEKGVAGMFVVVPELLRAIRNGYKGDGDTAGKLVQAAETAPLLVLDDLGAEKPTDWVQEQLFIIINRRYEELLPTLITTNCNMAELIDRIGRRTADRILEMTTPINIKAADYRMKA